LSKKQSSGSPLGSSHSNSTNKDSSCSKEEIVVSHGSARSIVFRDHLRLAAKIIEEETDQDLLSNDEMSLDDSDDDGDSALESHRGFGSMPAEIKESLRESIRESIREQSENDNISGVLNEIKPLPKLELGPLQTFEPLEQDQTTEDSNNWTLAEREVYQLLKKQQACVKTIKFSEWPSFLQRFQTPRKKEKFSRFPNQHDDIPPNHQKGFPFNSFVTSTSLLPELGKKMRSYGSIHAYPVGVVFALPTSFTTPEEEDQAARATETWSWPAGYAAKTEFNIERGRLINGRQEAIVPLSQMRQYNHEYVHNKDHHIGCRIVKGGFQVVPYNEVFLRIGGRGRMVQGIDIVTNEPREDSNGTGRSYEKGMGLPVALFVRSTTIGDILTLFRTKARLEHVLGDAYIHGIPLLVITPEKGVRVFSEGLQHEFWKLAAHKVNPFQNPILEPMLKVDDPNQNYLRQKALEQISFFDDDDENPTEKKSLSSYLTIEECARLAGGFGATDECLAKILEKAREQDLLQETTSEHENNTKGSPSSSRLRRRNRQDSLNKVMAAGLDAALRSNDYYTARQLLIVYSIVSTGHYHDRFEHNHKRKKGIQRGSNGSKIAPASIKEEESSDHDGYDADVEDPESLEFSYRVSERSAGSALSRSSSEQSLPNSNEPEEEEEKSNGPQSAGSAPPILDTWRLRNATNSHGILFVLGAVEILSSVRNESAQNRTAESIDAIEEWVQHGEESVAFRIASWSKQRATEHDTNVALEGSSPQFLAFVSNKAITNRKGFAQKLKSALKAQRDCEGASSKEAHLRYLKGIQAIVNSLHAPCLRLEILQYILGLDNRFSVDHIRHSTELAVTCMALGLS